MVLLAGVIKHLFLKPTSITGDMTNTKEMAERFLTLAEGINSIIVIIIIIIIINISSLYLLSKVSIQVDWFKARE